MRAYPLRFRPPLLAPPLLTLPACPRAGEAADGGDGDGSGSEGYDSDLSDTYSGDETFFEEQFPGEAEAALASGDVDHLLTCFANPEQLAEAMAKCDALALNPAVAEVLEIFESHDVEADEPWLARIAQMRERAAAGTPPIASRVRLAADARIASQPPRRRSASRGPTCSAPSRSPSSAACPSTRCAPPLAMALR